MKIGIDARLFGPEQGGLGRYIEQLILHLEKIEGPHEFIIFLRKKNWDSYHPINPHFKKVLADIPWYGWREQFFLTKMINKEHCDLVHFPHWNVPLCYRRPFIVTIHDLLLLHYPSQKASTLSPLYYRLKQGLFRLVLNHAARKAKHIITVSEFSKQDIAATLRIPTEKISVTYLAPYETADQSNETALNEKKPKTNNLKSLGINRPYILYVGVAFPHKNLDSLLKAWKLFCQNHGHAYQLVLAGPNNYFYQKLQSDSMATNVIFTGFVSDNTLAELYANAALYVFPSLYEGFGLPPLEALRHCVPVVASSASCLPEILGDGADYFDPLDIQMMATTLWRGLKDLALREKILATGPKTLSRYSWAATAEKTMQLYLNTVDKNRI